MKEPGTVKRANMKNITAMLKLAIGTCILEQRLTSEVNLMAFQH